MVCFWELLAGSFRLGALGEELSVGSFHLGGLGMLLGASRWEPLAGSFCLALIWLLLVCFEELLPGSFQLGVFGWKLTFGTCWYVFRSFGLGAFV